MEVKNFVNSLLKTEDKEELLKLLSIYETFSIEKREKVQNLLKKEENGKWYSEFLSYEKKDLLKKKKGASWLLARKIFGISYDRERVKKIIETEKELEQLRNKIYEVINETYNDNQDIECSKKISLRASKEKRRIVCGRFSRAFYIDALLLANSKLISSKIIPQFLNKIKNKIDSLKFMPDYLSTELNEIEYLIEEKEIPKSQILGVLKKLEKDMIDYEIKLIQKYNERRLKYEIYENDRRIIDNLRKDILKIKERIEKEKGKSPVYMIFFQRIFPIDAIFMGVLNELMDPFFGQDPHIEELLSEGGENIYVTSGMKNWLKICDDWIEALPAYASYEIIPENGSYKFKPYVQRNILEEMYRINAENWAENINDVMLTENLQLAREIISLLLNIKYKDEEDLIEKIKRRKLEKEVSMCAVLVEKTYENLIEEIGRICEKENILRLDALRKIIKERKDIIGEIFEKFNNKKSLKNILEEFIKKYTLEDRIEEYLKNVDRPRRDLPSVHVLTTLGPGETEFNVRNWLEESMLLYNLLKRKNLLKKVEEKMKIWRENIVKVGEKIVKENNLESEIYKYDEKNISNGIIKLLIAYPEIGKELSTLMVLLIREGENIDDKNFRVKEPEDVIKQLDPEIIEKLNTNKLSEEEAELVKNLRQKFIEKYNLSKDVDEFIKNYLHPVYSKINAQRKIVVEEGLLEELNKPIYRYEAKGGYKKYNLLYTPSRVDLGAKEVYSVRDIPKWVGGIDSYSALKGKSLYSLYNIAGPTVIPSTKIAEFLKVGENFFSRGGIFYLSLTAGINLDTLRFGEFEFFRTQWNMRGDRIVLPSGETYGGFCVPKEFSLLYAIIISAVDKETSKKILNSFGIPEKLHSAVIEDMRKILSFRCDYQLEIDWEGKALSYLYSKYPEYFKIFGQPTYLSRLPQIAITLEKMGIVIPEGEEERINEFKLTYWVNKKAQGLEEINRIGPFRKVKLIYDLIKKARKKNKYIVNDDELIGVMDVSYKESELEDGRLIPVSDVRFSAGCRKLEIYSLVAEKHILVDIDPEGRSLIKEIFKNFVPPADIRIVGKCTGSDILNHVPNSGLEEIKNQVINYLYKIGLDDNLIKTNCIVYGGDIRKWVGIRERNYEEIEKIYNDLKGKIHLLVIDKRGPFSSYKIAIRGVDFVDLGIPDPELLQLIDNLPEFIYLIKKERPYSALVFADGTSGARRPSFSYNNPNCRRKVKELFAIEEKAVYGCLGIGEETIADWRKEMEIERDLSEKFLNLLMEGNKNGVNEVLKEIRNYLLKENKVEQTISEENQAKRVNTWGLKDKYYTLSLILLAKETNIEYIDFGKWLIFGGIFLINGKYTTKEMIELRKKFEEKLNKLGYGKSGFKKTQIDFIIKEYFRPLFIPEIKEKYEEISTGLAGSLKAAEVQTQALKRWEERKREYEKIKSLRRKLEEYKKFDISYLRNLTVEKINEEAKKILGKPERLIPPENFGKFLKITRFCIEKFVSEWKKGIKEEILGLLDRFFESGEIKEEDYIDLTKSIANLAALKENDIEFYEKILSILELLDISFLIELTLNCWDESEYNSQIAKFFDRTINSHIFDYFPYHFYKERCPYFEKLERDVKFKLAYKFHQYLYRYLRYLICEKTELKNYSELYRDLYIGNILENKNAIGIKGETPEEIFWFHYGRMRDIVVLKYEGFGYPEIFIDVEPEDLKTNERVNVVIVYPYGNTTVPVALQQGPKFAKNSINLFISAFPIKEEINGVKLLKITEAMIYPPFEEIENLRKKYKNIPQNRSDFIFVKFKNPVVVHSIFFHFTHPLRPEIDHFKIPIIQPLIWEAATHLKCELPKMLKGSGVKVPEQINWYMEDTERLKNKAKEKIREKIIMLSKKYDTLIVKCEKESGGRKSMILPVRENSKIIEKNVNRLTELVYEISLTDNAVIQEVIPSRVRQLYTREFLEDVVERFAKIGIPVLIDKEPKTPLYSYFRQIVVLGKDGYKISHHITVISTRGIANVGQGGLLYEYTDDIINPKYRKTLRTQITNAVYKSLEYQQKYIERNWKFIIEEYLKIHPEFKDKVKYEKTFEDLTGFPITGIPYEMGDYMPLFLVDEFDNLKYLYNEKEGKLIPLYDKNGYPTDVKIYDENRKEIVRIDKNKNPIPIPYFDENGNPRKIYNENGEEIPSLIICKIEPNPGAGLWRPHNDRLPPERKGEGVFIIFSCLAERGKIYKEKIEKLINNL